MSAEATGQKLPKAFEHLSGHLGWAMWEEKDRMERQVSSTVEELAEFYDAMLPHTGEIYKHLEKLDVSAEMSEEDRTLFSLAIAFAEIVDGVEYYSPESTSASAMPRFEIGHPILGWRWTPTQRLP